MATGHWSTNKGKLYLAQGKWDTAGATDIRLGLIKSPQPASLDTAAEVADLNFVSDLLALCSECNFTNYVRVNLTRTAAAEDDTNDRVNMDASDVVIAAAGGAINNTIVGAFTFDNTGGADTARILISVDWFVTSFTTTGGTYTYPIVNQYQLQ